MGIKHPPQKDPLGSKLRYRLFGAAEWKSVLSRMGVDFLIANCALIAASLCRLMTSRQLSASDPIGSVAQRVNSEYAVNAAWFCITGILLLAFNGFYRPIPSGRLHDRLISAAKSCVAGFVLQLIFGSVILGRPLPALEWRHR